MPSWGETDCVHPLAVCILLALLSMISTLYTFQNHRFTYFLVIIILRIYNTIFYILTHLLPSSVSSIPLWHTWEAGMNTAIPGTIHCKTNTRSPQVVRPDTDDRLEETLWPSSGNILHFAFNRNMRDGFMRTSLLNMLPPNPYSSQYFN